MSRESQVNRQSTWPCDGWRREVVGELGDQCCQDRTRPARRKRQEWGRPCRGCWPGPACGEPVLLSFGSVAVSASSRGGQQPPST